MKKQYEMYFFLLPSLIFILIFGLYPLFYTINLSFKDVTLISYIRGNAEYVGFSNFIDVIRDSVFKRTFLNTLIFTAFSLIFQFLLGFLLALLFNRSFPLKNFFQSLIMLPWVIPIIVSGSFYRWFFSDNGMFNGILIFLKLVTKPIPWITSENLPILAIIIANIWLGIPFNFILLYTGLTQIPIELLESSEIDGASGWEKVIYIILPVLKPVSIATLVLGTIFTMKVFDLVWIITQGGPGDVSHLFSTLSYSWAFNKFQFGKASAVLIFMLIIVVILTVLLNSIKTEEA